MSATILSYTQFCSGIILLLFALIQLVYRNKSAVNYVLSAIFFCIAFTVLYLWLLRSGAILYLPALMYHDVTVTFSIGPLLYFYTRLILGTANPPAKIWILNFISAALSLITIITVNIINPDPIPVSASSGSVILDYSHDIIIWWMDKLSNVSMIIYFALSILAIRKYLRAKSISANPELYFLFLYMFAVIGMAGVMLISTIISSDALLSFSVTALAILGVLYIVVSFRYPGFTQKAIREARVMRIRKMIEEENKDDSGVILEFETLMHESRIFTDEKLSLNDASRMLGVTTHHLSRIINDMTGMNFRNYLNSFRVREAQTLLRDKPGMSVIEIAFATGFNSKSSFNDAFLKTTGVSPRDYRGKTRTTGN
jgi:AraC-like DNA-binding protein